MNRFAIFILLAVTMAIWKCWAF